MPDDHNSNTVMNFGADEEYLQRIQERLDPFEVDQAYWPPNVSSTRPGDAFRLLRMNRSARQTSRLEKEQSELAQQVEALIKNLANERRDNLHRTATVNELRAKLAELEQKKNLMFLLARIHPKSHDRLIEDPQFREPFSSEGACNAFVVAVDIRRSTELMLKARTPKLFANFISSLCERLENVIKESCGVFDKFTGDGILAFFPEFFSGDDAGYLALEAAQKCQDVFQEHYRNNRKSFTTVLNDVGLGIGIDFGPVQLLKVADGMTVVGSPVVYSCRLSAAPAGHIYLNQPAAEVILESYGSCCYANEVILNVKNEGNILCYDVRLKQNQFSPALPDWITSQHTGPTQAVGAMKSQVCPDSVSQCPQVSDQDPATE